MPILSGPGGISSGVDPRTMIARVGPCIPIAISLPKVQEDAIVQAGGVPSTATHGQRPSAWKLSSTTVLTAGGMRRATRYLAQAEIGGSVSELWEMTGASLASGGILALIGTDFLTKCLLVYDGPGGRFSLAL